MLGSITTEQVYLELTFVTLAMLVVGGVTSLWGAVVGALAVSVGLAVAVVGVLWFLSRTERRDRRRVLGVGSQPVDRLRRQDDETPGAQGADSGRYLRVAVRLMLTFESIWSRS